MCSFTNLMFSGNRRTTFDDQMMSPCRFPSETFIKQNAGENSSIPIPFLNNLQNADDKSSKAMTVKTRNYKRSGGKSTYRHVPHCQKPPHLVARRNARERRRVQAVNSAFLKLRRHVPFETKHKRLSKVKTLRGAIEYIGHLQEMILEFDRKQYQKFGNRNGNSIPDYNRNLRDFSIPSALRDRINQQAIPGFNWPNECPNEIIAVPNEVVPAPNSVNGLPEYGSLGMNEISVLPDV